MSCYLLDTSIIGNVTKPTPSKALLAWMGEQVDENLFIASLTVAEIRREILEKPAGRKRDQQCAVKADVRKSSTPFRG
jgi:predicted nucleic acid-binding protein